MRRLLGGVLLALVVLGGSGGPGLAKTIPGEKQDIEGLDNAGATADHYIRNLAIQLLGIGTMITGGAMLGASPITGVLTASGGLGIIFVPNIISSGAQQAQGATSLAFTAPGSVWVPWLASVHSVLPAVAVVASMQIWRRRRRRRA